MTLKDEFYQFVLDELKIPLVGAASPNEISQEDVSRITPVLELLARSNPLAEGLDNVLHPKDFLPEARTIIVTGSTCYFGEMLNFEQCREKLIGRADSQHANPEYIQHIQETALRISEFFARNGFQCFSITGGQFPIKLAASKCGVGFYGKNCNIQHPDYGSWISLSAYVTDAGLEMDEPIEGDCGDCELCMKACPTGALYAPYQCNAKKCLNFHLAWNKKKIPYEIRKKCSNLLEENCNVCRDVCIKNRKLKPINDFSAHKRLAYPSLLRLAEITQDEWNNGYGLTLAGLFLLDKKYLQRNAIIGLGNFKDERALQVLKRVLVSGDDEIRGYAAWALGRIGTKKAKAALEKILSKDLSPSVHSEIEYALDMI